MKFKAAIFDFDGTVTGKGAIGPSQEMADCLLNLAKKMPIAFCTGRQLDSFVHHGLGILLKEIGRKERDFFLKNFYLMAENGAIGYRYSEKLGRFTEFYTVPWPDEFIKRKKLSAVFGKAVKKFGHVHRSKAYASHKVAIVLSTKLANVDPAKRDINEVYRLSDEMYKIVVSILEKLNPDYEKFLHVGNSGIGVLIGPADGDKDNGIKKFAEILRQKRGFSFSKNLRDILVVGDRPDQIGNDYYFLKGKYGTPYTVGSLGVNKKIPRSVIDKSGRRLLHSKGLIYLINSILA